jgi:hypothetical protein
MRGVLRRAVEARRSCVGVERQGSVVGPPRTCPWSESLWATAQVKFVKAEDMVKATSGFGKYTLLDIRPEVDFLAVRPRKTPRQAPLGTPSHFSRH